MLKKSKTADFALKNISELNKTKEDCISEVYSPFYIMKKNLSLREVL